MRRWIPVLILIAVAPFAGAAPQPAGKANLEAQLRSLYVWTNYDGQTGDVIAPGTVLAIRKNGISTNPVNAPFNAQNNYKDGQVKRSALSFFTQDDKTAGQFLAGDRVYVTKTEVKDNSVVVSLLSVELFGSLRAKASVSFPFPKGFAQTTRIEQIAGVIDELLVADAEREAEPPPTSPAGSPPVEAAYPSEPVAIELGMTPERVLGILGDPDIIADLGRKQIFFFPDLKVTFLDGKVTDVK